MTNGFFHLYHLVESIFKLGASEVFFHFSIRNCTVWPILFFRMFSLLLKELTFIFYLFHFSMKNMSANRIAPDGTPRLAASHLGLFCLPLSHKKDARLIWVKTIETHKKYITLMNLTPLKINSERQHLHRNNSYVKM